LRLKPSQRSKPFYEPVTAEENAALDRCLGPLNIVEHPLPEHLKKILHVDNNGVYSEDVAGESSISGFEVGERFQSPVTGLQIELVEKTKIYSSKGRRWNTKTIKSGDTSFKPGHLSYICEQTLLEDFEFIENIVVVERELKKRGRPPKEVEASILPAVELPTSFHEAWESWPVPQVETGKLQDFKVSADVEENSLFLYKHGMREGEVTPTALDELGKKAGFPPEFLKKLSLLTAVQVINERITAYSGPDVTMLFEEDKWTNILPAWRGVLPTKVTAEIVYRKLKEFYPEMEIEKAERREGFAFIRLLTPVAYPVTTAVGDVLRLGVDIRHQYGETIEVSLYTKRLAGLEEFISNTQEFSWKVRTDGAGSKEHQAVWLLDTVMQTLCAYTPFVENAKLMAQDYFKGTANVALGGLCIKLGIPTKYAKLAADLVDGNTRWDLAIALSHVADDRDIKAKIGEWIAKEN
jgi:hypothetical protein